MNTREQFGKYLLLKKLTEDPLGETFRSGMLGEGGMERVVLLRIFNGQGVDGQRLWEAVKDRAELPKLLRNPNIGEGVEMGEIQGLPYVAYDYISGKNMATLLEQAAKKRNFIPAEHALLITERAALALAAASETRFQGSRIHHGFVCPHLVMISNEGETRLLGFEVAPGLRTFAANPVIRQHFGRYLAPEALGGQPPHPADDVYSLGVMLFELITGRPLPPPVDGSFGPVIEQGTVATEGTPIPDDVAGLLKSSLVPRDQRVADVGSWHKALNKLMFEGQYNPTTFNLAFFMHNLFRQDIERESQEIEVEKTLPLPTVQKQQAPPPAPPAEDTGVREGTGTGVREGTGTGIREGTGTGVREATGVDEATENFIPEYAKDQEKSKLGLIVAAVVLLLAVGAGAYFFLGGSGGGEEEPAQVATTPPPPPPAPLEPEEPSGPTVEEINAKIQELVEQKSAAMEDELRKGYEDELSDLRDQLERTRREAEERRRRQEEMAEQLADEEAAAEAEDAEQTADAGEGDEAAAGDLPGDGTTEVADNGEEGAAGEGADAETQLAEQQPPPAEPETEVAPPPPPPPPPKATTQKSQVRRGDLVEPGPGVALPKLVRQPPARFPEQARRMRRSGATVLVRALVDENGRVIDTKLLGEKHGFGFDAAAVNAVEKSLYKPATKDGVPVKIWHTVAVEFRN